MRPHVWKSIAQVGLGLSHFLLVFIGWTAWSLEQACAAGQETNRNGMVLVPAGVHRPLFRMPDERPEVPIQAFYLSMAPVTNDEFLEFVRQNPRWRRSKVKSLFADEGYLAQWARDLDLGPAPVKVGKQPVTRVSWFAAKAYAAWRDCRLPSTAEWEYAAGAGFARRLGAEEPEFVATLRKWYSMPAPEELPPAGSGKANYFGIHDLHGLVWEWTRDFNSEIVTGDARGDTGLERQLFCGAGSQGVKDRGNYPAFMRSGLRSSLKANYTVANLGFRCARSVSE